MFRCDIFIGIGFHKAVDEHDGSPVKQISNGLTKVEDENYRNKYDEGISSIEFKSFFRRMNEISLPISCKLVSQTVLQTSLENVLSLRLREGYTVRRVQIGRGFLHLR